MLLGLSLDHDRYQNQVRCLFLLLGGLFGSDGIIRLIGRSGIVLIYKKVWKLVFDNFQFLFYFV